MTVREYLPTDLRAMADIWNEIVEQGASFPQESTLTLDGAAAFFGSQSYSAVCEDNGEIIGLYILHPNNVGRCGHIANASFAVKSDRRGMHIGEALVSDCVKNCGRFGFKILQFNAVAADNTPALKLYKKLGFTQLGVIPKGFRKKDGSYMDIIPHYIDTER